MAQFTGPHESERTEQSSKEPTKAVRRSRTYKPGQPRYECHYTGCQGSYSRLEHLKRHLSKHQGPSSMLICDLCNGAFSRKDVLIRHKQRTHGVFKKNNTENNDPALDDVHPTDSISNAGSPQTPTAGLVESLGPGILTNSETSFPGNVKNTDQLRTVGNAAETHLSHNSRLENNDSHVIISPNQKSHHSLVGEKSLMSHDSLGIKEAGIETEYHTPRLHHSRQMTPTPARTMWNNTQNTSYLLNEDFIDWLITQNEQLSDQSRSPFEVKGDSQRFDWAHVQAEFGSESIDNLEPNFYYHIPDFRSEPSVNGDLCDFEVIHGLITLINRPSDPLVVKFMTPAFLSHALSIYWTIHVRWPFLHKPTFDMATAPPHLLLAMITLGMVLVKDPEAHELAINIHTSLRFSVYMLPDFMKSPPLWAFQTLLLAEIFQMYASTEEQHDMAVRFHNVLASSLRAEGFIGDRSAYIESEGDKLDYARSLSSLNADELEERWYQYVFRESKMRVAYFVFHLDTQHCIFFRKQASVYLADFQCPLPCPEAVWEAPDAYSWKKALLQHPEPPPPFLNTVSAYLKLRPPEISLLPWSMTTVLYGLISIAYNIQMRDQLVKLSGERERQEEKRLMKMVSQAYNGWIRQYKILFISTGKIPHDHPYFLGCMSVYEFAQMSLGIHVLSIQKFVAILSPQGDEPLDELFLRGMVGWAQSASATKAITHALDLIDLFLAQDKPYDGSKETSFLRPWTLYNATIAVWTYHYLRRFNERHIVDSEGDCLNYLRACVGRDSEKVVGNELVNLTSANKPLAGVLCDVNRMAVCNANPLIEATLLALGGCRMPKLLDHLSIMRGLIDA